MAAAGGQGARERANRASGSRHRLAACTCALTDRCWVRGLVQACGIGQKIGSIQANFTEKIWM